MSREDIIAVASRLLAVYIAVLASQPAVSLLSFPESEPLDVSVILIQLGTSLALVATAALLWCFPLAVARRLLPVMRSPQPAVSLPGELALSLALAVLGFWLLAQALSDAVYWSSLLVFETHMSNPVTLLPEHKGAIVSTVFELAMATVLILGHQGIASGIRRMRSGAAQRQDQPGAL